MLARLSKTLLTPREDAVSPLGRVGLTGRLAAAKNGKKKIVLIFSRKRQHEAKLRGRLVFISDGSQWQLMWFPVCDTFHPNVCCKCVHANNDIG